MRIEVGGENGLAVSEAGLKTWKFRDKTEADDQLLDEINNKKPASTAGGTSATDMALDMHGRNIQHILESWDAGKDAETAGPEARKAIAIILAMYESARKNGMPIPVK